MDLCCYIEDGRLEISDYRAEMSIKPFIIGKKNWLFSDTQLGTKVSTTIFSVIETARKKGLDSYEYLKYIITKTPNSKEDESIDILLPWVVTIYCCS